MGTSVISGTATALVCRTGRATELGSLARGLAAQRPPDAFENGIRSFGLLMLRFTIFLVLFVLAANVVFQRPWLESLLFALALAVGLDARAAADGGDGHARQGRSAACR